VGGPFSASAYTYISFFQATGEGKKSFFLALLRKGLVDIPLMFLLNPLWPAYGIVLATPVADALCCAAANGMYRKYLREKTGDIGQIRAEPV
jgi:Na+-driven multidrug efflux pump